MESYLPVGFFQHVKLDHTYVVAAAGSRRRRPHAARDYGGTVFNYTRVSLSVCVCVRVIESNRPLVLN